MVAKRNLIVLGCATALAACGGGTGPQTVGGSAPPTAGGSGSGDTHSFVNPTEAKTYEAIGGVHHYEYYTDSNKTVQRGQLYAGDANTARDSGISVAYDPRDAIFELTISRPNAQVSTDGRFQDPAHRTDFGGAKEPQAGVPNLDPAKNIQYLQFGSGSGSQLPTGSPYYTAGAAQSDYVVGARDYTSDTYSFFYQKPGTTTQYVTYAGYVHNQVSASEIQDDPASPSYLREQYHLDRGAFVFGERTTNANVPKTGSGTFTGDMIATMVFNPDLDTNAGAPTYFQWIDGSQTTTVDFGALSVKSDFTGTVLAPSIDAYTSGASSMPAGSTFSASAQATIDLVNKGGFTGSFTSAKFERPGMSDFTVNIAGSSIDGAFFGPNGEEIGGGFRIVGGTPDERIDILGAFTGKK
ncbi:transferrin-binding protein-like solute binding protein [Stakelama marina]|uniref:Transferrin-binding protein-like solute binding protein n=1 Tax=Stakelama marina TaxID=2826939 RepID=A0A8T4IAC5_9SPHN|nr:transferrin-binding protein-like solute binding protein [Stakelama marina]MBR0551313.1 transferrin-binding protein-like solute binding protein [Stakelama marina]